MSKNFINVYNNTMVRKGQRIKNEKKHAQGLIKFVEDRYAKQIDKRSSQKGKDVQIAKRDELLTFFSKSNLKNLENVFKLQNFIVDSKLIIINKLNKLNKIGTFVKTTSGFKVTNPEGFVAISAFVLFLMLYAMVKFRASRNPNPSKRTHNVLVEVIWTLVPCLILIVLLNKYHDLTNYRNLFQYILFLFLRILNHF